jgi:pyochelin biosynthetic protein PchC
MDGEMDYFACFLYINGISKLYFTKKDMCCRWSMMLPAAIQVCCVEVPRRDHLPTDDPLELASLLAESLPINDKPYAIFGASIGGNLAYEVVRAIEERVDMRQPQALMVAASQAPERLAVILNTGKVFMQAREISSHYSC